MIANDVIAGDTTDRQIIASRIISAPRELVFEAFTNPEHVAQWWGPNGFTNTTKERNVVPGGIWRFTFHGPDGRNYPNKVVFLEIKKPEMIAFKHIIDDETERVNHHQTLVFEDLGSKTKLTMTLVFESPEERERVVKEYGAIEGAKQTLGRLEELMLKLSEEEDLVHIREFNAPRELVFKAWTEPERLAQWWGPKGMNIEVKKFDLQPGGVFLYSMAAPDGKKIWGKFTYREIAAPERLAFVNAFSDADGNNANNPWMPTWPSEIYNLLTLVEHDGKTKLVLRGRPINANAEEKAAFRNMRSSMEEGFKGTFEQLDEYLANTNK